MVVASEVDRVLADAVEAGTVPGVVALGADARGVVYAGAFGTRVIDQDWPMNLDTVMRLASMTKVVTSVAAMRLVEQGRIGLDEAVDAYMPELAAVQVLEAFDDPCNPWLRPPHRPITLRHLLTHTAGFTYDDLNGDLLRYRDYAGIPPFDELKKACLAVPLVRDPGDRWEYGISTDWVGQVVERLSGQSLEDYFREYILAPLGMNDTGFVLRPEQRSRLAGMHERQPDGPSRSFRSRSRKSPSSSAVAAVATACTRPGRTTCGSYACCSAAASSTACGSCARRPSPRWARTRLGS